MQIIEEPGLGALLGKGAGEGFSKGMQTLSEELAKERKDKRFLDHLDKLPEDATTEEKIAHVIEGPGSPDQKTQAYKAFEMMEKVKEAKRKQALQQQQQQAINQALGLPTTPVDPPETPVTPETPVDPKTPVTPETRVDTSEKVGDSVPSNLKIGAEGEAIDSINEGKAPSTDITKNLSPNNIAAIATFNPALGKLLNNMYEFQASTDHAEELAYKRKTGENIATNANDYYIGLKKSGEAAEKTLGSIDLALEAGKGKTGAGFRSALHAVVDTFHSPIAQMLLSKDQQAVLEAGKHISAGAKDIFQGTRMTEKMFFWMENAVAPTIYKPGAVNKDILERNRDLCALTAEKSQVADEIRRENRGMIPHDIDLQVQERMRGKATDAALGLYDQSEAEIPMLDPNGGQLFVPANRVREVLELGGDFAEPTARR